MIEKNLNDDFINYFVSEFQNKKRAFLDDAQKNKPVQGHRITLDLTNARSIDDPFRVDFPFKSVYMEQATDPTCNVYLKPVSREDLQPPFRMSLKDSWSLDYQLPRCFLHWDAQPGKKIDLVFFADSEFRSGSQIQVTSGGITINNGSGFSTSIVTENTNSTIQLLSQNPGRKIAYLQNVGNNPIYLANSNIVIPIPDSFEIPPNSMFEWTNSAALYARSDAPLKVKILEMT